MSDADIWRRKFERERNAREEAERLFEIKNGQAQAAKQVAEDARSQLIDAINCLPEAFLLVDSDNRILMVNEQYRLMFEGIQDMLHRGTRYDAVLQAALDRGLIPNIADPDGWIRERMTKFRSPSGRQWEQTYRDGRTMLISEFPTSTGGVVSLRTDITTQKKNTELMLNRLAAIEASRDGIVLTHPDGLVSFSNQAQRDMFGYSFVKDIAELHWWDLYNRSEIEPFTEASYREILGLGHWRGEAMGRRKDGKLFPIEISLTALEGGRSVCVTRDITDRKLAETEQRSLHEQLYQAQKMEAIGRLAGGIAHDFNNILSAMLGYTSFLVEDLPEGSEEQDFAKQVMVSGQRAKKLVQQILSFSRQGDSGRADIDVHPLIEETVAMLKVSLPAGIRLKTDILEEPATINANATQVGQVLMNLCVNARDAISGDHGSIVITADSIITDGGRASGLNGNEEPQDDSGDAMGPIRIETAEDGTNRMWIGVLERPGKHLRMSVSDTGSGIERSVMERMFEPFFTTKAVNKGTGLGLSAVHGIVSSHGGAMTIESQPGKGTKFSILLPLTEAEQVAVPICKPASMPSGSENVLVVDDEPLVASMMVHQLKRLGYESESVQDPLQALECVRREPYRWNLVITDYMMPQLSGIELITALRGEGFTQPIILISGFSDTINQTTASEAGASAFLRKPAPASTMATMVRHVLDNPDGGTQDAEGNLDPPGHIAISG